MLDEPLFISLPTVSSLSFEIRLQTIQYASLTLARECSSIIELLETSDSISREANNAFQFMKDKIVLGITRNSWNSPIFHSSLTASLTLPRPQSRRKEKHSPWLTLLEGVRG